MKQSLINLQAAIERYYSTRTDKLIHFFVFSLFLVPVSLVFQSWLVVVAVVLIGASLKEAFDKFVKRTTWDWEDWAYTVLAGLVQGIILLTK